MAVEFVTTRYGKTNKLNRRGYYNLQTKIGGNVSEIVTPNSIAIKKLTSVLNKKMRETNAIKQSDINTYVNVLKSSEQIRFMYMPILAEAIIIHKNQTKKKNKEINYDIIDKVSEQLIPPDMSKNITNDDYYIVKCRIFATILRYFIYLNDVISSSKDINKTYFIVDASGFDYGPLLNILEQNEFSAFENKLEDDQIGINFVGNDENGVYNKQYINYPSFLTSILRETPLLNKTVSRKNKVIVNMFLLIREKGMSINNQNVDYLASLFPIGLVVNKEKDIFFSLDSDIDDNTDIKEKTRQQIFDKMNTEVENYIAEYNKDNIYAKFSTSQNGYEVLNVEFIIEGKDVELISINNNYFIKSIESSKLDEFDEINGPWTERFTNFSEKYWLWVFENGISPFF
jgi:hypothetical protein